MEDLMNLLNAYDFKAFPQQNNPDRVTLSVACNDGNRYFITSVNRGTKENPKWEWAPGEQMRPMNKENLNAKGLGPISSVS